jgi:hypothetical protein
MLEMRGSRRIEDSVSDQPNAEARSLIGYITRDDAPGFEPAPISRTWMSDMQQSWPHRCLPILIANQSGWEMRNPCAFTATWMGRDDRMGVTIAPDKPAPGQFLPCSEFGSGIVTWHLPMLFRTPAGYNLLVRGPANYPKDGASPLEGVVETDWASASFSMSWKLTRRLMPVRFEVDEPICMIVPQRRAELEEFVPELRRIESDENLHSKYEFFLCSRSKLGETQAETNTNVGDRVPWQGDYARGRHADGAAGAHDHQTRRRLRPFVEQPSAKRR